MAGAEEGVSGPPQGGRNAPGQYVYWITMVHPKEETVQRLEVKTPSDFTREEFCQLMVVAHQACSIELVETDGLPSMDLAPAPWSFSAFCSL